MPHDAATLDIASLGRAVALLLGDCDEGVQGIGRALQDWTVTGGDLAGHLGIENERGRSGRLAAAIERRNGLLRELGSTVSVQRLAAEMANYAGTSWPRDRIKPALPYPAGSRKALLWQVMRLLPRALSERSLRKIVT
jgi:hypothetical protein